MGGLLEHEPGLLARHPAKSLEKVGQLRPVLQNLEERGHRHARAAKHPGATDALRASVHGGP